MMSESRKQAKPQNIQQAQPVARSPEQLMQALRELDRAKRALASVNGEGLAARNQAEPVEFTCDQCETNLVNRRALELLNLLNGIDVENSLNRVAPIARLPVTTVADVVQGVLISKSSATVSDAALRLCQERGCIE